MSSCQAAILKRKYAMLDKQRDILAYETGIKKLQRRLQDRRAALLAFETEMVRADRAKQTMLRVGASAVPRVYAAWVQYVAIRHHERELIDRCFSRMQNVKLLSGFITWKKLQMSTHAMMESATAVTGLGSRMLVKSQWQRTDLQGDVQAVLSGLARMKLNMDECEMTQEQASSSGALLS